MRTPRPALVLLLCVLIPASLSAQQLTTSSAPPLVTSDPQAVALIQKALRALSGGLPVTDVTLTGSARRIAGSDDETGTAILTAMAGGYSKFSLNFPSGPRVEIRNPAETPLADSVPPEVSAQANLPPQPVGASSGPDGVLHGVPAHNVMTEAGWFFPAFTIVSVASTGTYAVSYLGSESFQGQTALHVVAIQPSSDTRPGIAAFMQHLTQMDLWLDPTTLLPVSIGFNTHPDDNASVDIAVQILFSDYRSVNGLRVPFHVEKYLNNGLVLDLHFSDASLNSGLAATEFQVH